jgi:predicted protein tyrosine phosphatase
MSEFNRFHNISNPYQGNLKKVLCVCSAGLLRSPTLAYLLSGDPWNYNTRAVGTDVGHALIPVELIHLVWSDLIICMNGEQERFLKEMKKSSKWKVRAKIVCINVPDAFEYRDPALIELLKERIKEYKL